MHVDTQDPTRIRRHVLQGRLGVVEFGQQVDAALVERLAVKRRPDLPRRAFEQPDPEPHLERLDGMGGGGARDVERRRGVAETAQFDNAREQLQGIEAVHGEGSYC
ncbi:hypothetical protein D9M69_643770 [compost metagenome]